MKKTIVFLLSLLTLLHCQNPEREASARLDPEAILRINRQLAGKYLVSSIMMNKITISCQTKSGEANRALTREEYLTILRDEHFAVLPEEIQQQKAALNNLGQILQQDTVRKILEAGQEWSFPLSGTYGSIRVTIDKNKIAEMRTRGEAVMQVFREENMIDQNEYETISLALEKSPVLFPHQLYELILTGLNQ